MRVEGEAPSRVCIRKVLVVRIFNPLNLAPTMIQLNLTPKHSRCSNIFFISISSHFLGYVHMVKFCLLSLQHRLANFLMSYFMCIRFLKGSTLISLFPYKRRTTITLPFIHIVPTKYKINPQTAHTLREIIVKLVSLENEPVLVPANSCVNFVSPRKTTWFMRKWFLAK